MAGGSLNHGLLVTDLVISLGRSLAGGNCQVFGSEVKLGISAANAYYYPDAMVVCGVPEVESQSNGIILNPSAVFEVLSPGTGKFDREQKFWDYQLVPSIQEIVYLASHRMLMEVYERHPGGTWRYTAHQGDVIVPLESANVEVNLTRLYARLTLE